MPTTTPGIDNKATERITAEKHSNNPLLSTLFYGAFVVGFFPFRMCIFVLVDREMWERERAKKEKERMRMSTFCVSVVRHNNC